MQHVRVLPHYPFHHQTLWEERLSNPGILQEPLVQQVTWLQVWYASVNILNDLVLVITVA